MVVHPSLPAATVKEFIAVARARPGAITFASAGNGQSQHLAMELLKSMARVELAHVPYKGAGQFVPALAVDRINAEAAKALGDQQVIARLAPQGIEVIPSTPEEFQARLKEGIAKWAKVVKDAKIKPE